MSLIQPYLNLLRSSQPCLEAFPSPPGISYRRCKNLRDILVRATETSQAIPTGFESSSVVTEIGARRILHYRGKSVAEMTFWLAYILNVAFVALNHINKTGWRADVMSYAPGRMRFCSLVEKKSARCGWWAQTRYRKNYRETTHWSTNRRLRSLLPFLSILWTT